MTISLVALNRVKADRVEDFESLMREVVDAQRKAQPDSVNRWQLLRAEAAEDSVVVFVMLFQGGDPDEWALEPMLTRALGPDEARRMMTQFDDMLAEGQDGWIVTPVELAQASGHE